MKSKICITTGFNKPYKSIGDLCLKSIRKYADKFEYNVELNNKLWEYEEPHLAKIVWILELFEKGYDYVFWIDADALIVNQNEDIGNEIVAGKDLYLVKHIYHNIDIVNTGVMLIKNSNWSKALLKEVLKRARNGEMRKHAYYENGILNKILGYYWLPSNYFLKFLFIHFGLKFQRVNPYNEKYFGLIKFLNERWNTLLDEEMNEIEDPIIKHYANIDSKIALKEMKEDLKTDEDRFAEMFAGEIDKECIVEEKLRSVTTD